MARRSGETTRIINDAVEVFFTKGKIVVPYMTTKQSQLQGYKVDEDQIIIDIDGDVETTDSMQRHLLGKIMRRIALEHGNNSFVQEGFLLRLPTVESLEDE